MAKKKKKRKKRAAPAARARAPAPRRRAAPVPAPVLPEPTEEPGEPFKLEMEVMDEEAFPPPAAAPAPAPRRAPAPAPAPAPRRAPAPAPTAELPPEPELEFEEVDDDEPVDDTAGYAEPVDDTAAYAEQVEAQQAPVAQPAPARGYRQPAPQRRPAPPAAPQRRPPSQVTPVNYPARATQPPAVAGGALTGYAIARNPGQTASVVALNAGPRGLQFSDLDRIHVPAAGAQHWEIPGVTGLEAVAEWKGVVIHFRDERRYWAASYESTGGGTPPDCWSRDSTTGHGTPGEVCDDCPFAQWGTAGVDAQGRERPGQACRVARVLFVVRPNEVMPLVVSLPPTSIKAARKFFLRLGSKGVPYYAVEVKFRLAPAQSGSGLTYSQAVLSATKQLQPQDVTLVESLRDQLLPALEGVRARDGDFGK